MSEFGPIRNHYHVHLVDHSTSTRVGCSTFLQCYTALTRANQLETAVHGCRILLILGLVSIQPRSQGFSLLVGGGRGARPPREGKSPGNEVGLYHVDVAVVLSFLRSPISLAEIRVEKIETYGMDLGYAISELKVVVWNLERPLTAWLLIFM